MEILFLSIPFILFYHKKVSIHVFMRFDIIPKLLPRQILRGPLYSYHILTYLIYHIYFKSNRDSTNVNIIVEHQKWSSFVVI